VSQATHKRRSNRVTQYVTQAKTVVACNSTWRNKNGN